MSTRTDIGAGGRLNHAFAAAQWRMRTGVWPSAGDGTRLRWAGAPEVGGVGAQGPPALGRVLQCTVEPASARIHSREFSGTVSAHE